MSSRTLGVIVAAAGAILVLISALANVIGIGNTTEFDVRQVAGVIGGVVAMVIGGLAVRTPRR